MEQRPDCASVKLPAVAFGVREAGSDRLADAFCFSSCHHDSNAMTAAKLPRLSISKEEKQLTSMVFFASRETADLAKKYCPVDTADAYIPHAIDKSSDWKPKETRRK